MGHVTVAFTMTAHPLDPKWPIRQDAPAGRALAIEEEALVPITQPTPFGAQVAVAPICEVRRRARAAPGRHASSRRPSQSCNRIGAIDLRSIGCAALLAAHSAKGGCNEIDRCGGRYCCGYRPDGNDPGNGRSGWWRYRPSCECGLADHQNALRVAVRTSSALRCAMPTSSDRTI
jgi:hypothetical protein